MTHIIDNIRNLVVNETKSTAAPPLEILSHTGIEGVVLAGLSIRRSVGELVFEDELHSSNLNKQL